MQPHGTRRQWRKRCPYVPVPEPCGPPDENDCYYRLRHATHLAWTWIGRSARGLAWRLKATEYSISLSWASTASLKDQVQRALIHDDATRLGRGILWTSPRATNFPARETTSRAFTCRPQALYGSGAQTSYLRVQHCLFVRSVPPEYISRIWPELPGIPCGASWLFHGFSSWLLFMASLPFGRVQRTQPSGSYRTLHSPHFFLWSAIMR